MVWEGLGNLDTSLCFVLLFHLYIILTFDLSYLIVLLVCIIYSQSYIEYRILELECTDKTIFYMEPDWVDELSY